MFRNFAKNSVQMCFFRYLPKANQCLNVVGTSQLAIVFDLDLPRKFLFDFILTKFFHRLHVLAKQHNMNGAGYAKYIRLIGPRTTFEHLGARESISLDDL